MIPELKMPTEAELYEACTAKYDMAAPTYIDNWPDEWRAMSMHTTLIPLPPDAVAEMWGAHEGMREFKALSELAREIDAACNWTSHFIRLNTRSPKDVEERPITNAGRQALGWLMWSERTMDDLSMLEHARKPAYVAIREQVFIAKPAELRCFVRDGTLIAISQYHYGKAQATWQPDERRSEAWEVIENFWRSSVHPPSPIMNYVFDVALRYKDTPLLIEINPYGLSDPCAAGSYEQIETGGFFYVRS